MIAALLVIVSLYFAIRFYRRWNGETPVYQPKPSKSFQIFGCRAAMVEFFQNMQSVYRKWEEKAQPNVSSKHQEAPYSIKHQPFSSHTLLTEENIVDENEVKTVSAPCSRKNSSSYRKLSNGSVIPSLEGRFQSGHRRSHSGGPVPILPQRSTRSRFRLPAFSLPQWDRFAQFKSSPSMTPELGTTRPVMGTCCAHCVPTSKKALMDDPLSTLGMSDVLCVPSQNKENSFLVRTFHHLCYLVKRGAGYLYPDVSATVIRSERVQQAIELAIEDEIAEIEGEGKHIDQELLEEIRKKHFKRAIETLRRMRSCFSSVLLRLAGWVLYKLLGRMLSGILVHKGHIETIRKVTKRNLPIIYLPLHRSHLDYILVTFILYINDLKAPAIAAGDNLMIPFFGALMRGLGAFFIKRKLDTGSGRKDHVYRAVLHSYMVESLKANHSLEFFIEGGRSRTGKACLPKAGLLSVVVDSILSGAVEDAFIVPVAISYEKILDGNFVKEQLGKPKVGENFTKAVHAIWRTLHSNFGNVRVDFGQPFSVKEFLLAAKRRHSVATPLKQVPFPSLAIQTDNPLNNGRRKSSNGSLYGLDIVTKDNREVIKDLANHVIHDAANGTALMSTNLLSFLLLTKHRKGATLQQLTQSLSWLREELSSRHRDVGFTGEDSKVIKHAWSLLGKDLVTTETVKMEWSSMEMPDDNKNVRITFYKPVIRLPFVLELQYYANSVVSAFLMESIVVNAIFAELDEELEPWKGCKNSKVFISCNAVVQRAILLCDILQNEFIFVPPCADLPTVIAETIQCLVNKELLLPDDPVSVGGSHSVGLKRAWANRLECEMSDDDDDGLLVPRDRRVKINFSEESLNSLQFLRCILSPLIESYWISACSLVKLVNTEKEESLFFRIIQKTAEERLHKGLLSYEESFAAEPLKNSLKVFEQWNVLETHSVAGVRVLYLQNPYDNEDQLQEIISRIEDFRK